ncbi:MAG: hypothetical protein ACE1ZZ_06695, partial [Dehalococcoidia bacterium]
NIAILAVPGEHAQEVIDSLTECGVRAILNYAPIIAQAQPGMKIRNIDPVLALQSMTYYLTVRNIQKAGAGGAAMASRYLGRP